MHEHLKQNAEISAPEQQLFIDKLAELQPLLKDADIDLFISNELELGDDETFFDDEPSFKDFSTNRENCFVVGENLVRVALEESLIDSSDIPGVNLGHKRWVVYVDDKPEMLSNGAKLRRNRKYELNHFKFEGGEKFKPGYEETIYMKTHESAEWQKVHTTDVEATNKALKTLDAGDITESDFNDTMMGLVNDRAKLENLTGDSGTRFSRERFADVMTLLEDIDESKILR